MNEEELEKYKEHTRHLQNENYKNNGGKEKQQQRLMLKKQKMLMLKK